MARAPHDTIEVTPAGANAAPAGEAAGPPSHRSPPRSLLADGEAAAFEIVNPDGASRAILVCDHASPRLPHCLGTLGLAKSDLQSHIGWDPGAAHVARRLSSLLDAPLVLSGYSRLAIDCNRPLESPESIPLRTGGVAVPGNAGLTAPDRAQRAEALFHPYHRAIASVIDRRAGAPSLLLSVHSFTPVLAGIRRPWDIGFTYGRDRRLAALMLAEIEREAGLVVGDNEPYAVDTAFDHTIPEHGDGRAIPNVLIEIRQDRIATAANAGAWATRLADAFRRVADAACGDTDG
jgi:predicted N-formylglutamate amidohydrolase